MRHTLALLSLLALVPATAQGDDTYLIYSEEVYMGRTVNDGLNYYADNNSDRAICIEPFVVESHNVDGDWVNDIVVVPPHGKHVLLGSFRRVSLEDDAYIHADANAVADCQ